MASFGDRSVFPVSVLEFSEEMVFFPVKRASKRDRILGGGCFFFFFVVFTVVVVKVDVSVAWAVVKDWGEVPVPSSWS